MRDILIDVTRLLDRTLKGALPTGVDRITLAYIDHFSDSAQALVRYAGRWFILNRTESRDVFKTLADPDQKTNHVIRARVRRAMLRPWGRKNHPSILLNTDHNGLDVSGYADHVRRLNLQPYFFLHDLIPITHPEYSRAGEASRHRKRLTTMSSIGRGIIVNSAVTQKSLESYALQNGDSFPPTMIAPLPPAAMSEPQPCSPLSKPYFVILGTIEPRKNHLLLLQIWRALTEEMGDDVPGLVVIGQRGWECEQVIDFLDRSEDIQTSVIELSNCSDEDLLTWLHHSQALLFPTFTEGFGIPLVEALSAGVPVIASDLPIFHEIADDIPEYIDPLDGLGWKKQILAYTQTDSPARVAQLARMKAFRPSTWAEHFKIVDGFIFGQTP